MLENLDHNALRQRLGFEADDTGKPAVGSVAKAARACIQSWRFPARARVTAYLNRQFIAAGFQEDDVRNCVTNVIDALIDIGDVIRTRLDGKVCLVSSLPTCITIGDAPYVMLGKTATSPASAHDHRLYARWTSSLPPTTPPLPFFDWLGPAEFRSYLARRVSGQLDSTIQEFWGNLTATLQHHGNPLDPAKLRAVVGLPGTMGFFGRYNTPDVSGRWASSVPNGIWCGVRPGRNPNEWHPILASVDGSEAQALDLYDWDEWRWALLARGVVLGVPERSNWHNGILTFSYPIPAQFVRALCLLGGPGHRPWTWRMSEAANLCFDKWCGTQI